IDVLHNEFFKTSTSFGKKNRDLFKSNHPDRLEPEISDAMTALAAAGIWAALKELETGTCISVDLKADTTEGVYYKHCNTLAQCHLKWPNKGHRILSDLFTTVAYVFCFKYRY